MLDFMIIGLPRSGTTWAANWLTTDTIHCSHDPLYNVHYRKWDDQLVKPGRLSGISCTGIWRWSQWVNNHPARKVILHRDMYEIQESMQEIGLPPLERNAHALLSQIQGMHVAYTDLFHPRRAATIWEHLTGTPFNDDRHRALVDIEMQPRFAGLSVGEEVTRSLREELARIAGAF